MPSFNRIQLTGTDFQKSATIQDVFGGKTGTPGAAHVSVPVHQHGDRRDVPFGRHAEVKPMQFRISHVFVVAVVANIVGAILYDYARHRYLSQRH